MRIRRRLALAATVVAGALGLTGCGLSSSAHSAPPAPAVTTAPTSATTAPPGGTETTAPPGAVTTATTPTTTAGSGGAGAPAASSALNALSQGLASVNPSLGQTTTDLHNQQGDS